MSNDESDELLNFLGVVDPERVAREWTTSTVQSLLRERKKPRPELEPTLPKARVDLFLEKLRKLEGKS